MWPASQPQVFSSVKLRPSASSRTVSDAPAKQRSVRPHAYRIPMDGPVGKLLRAQGRHGYRPAHIHFLVGAPGYREVITAAYLASDEYTRTRSSASCRPW